MEKAVHEQAIQVQKKYVMNMCLEKAKDNKSVL